MHNLKVKTNPEVNTRFANYPKHVHDKMQHLRALVLETAKDIENITEIEETLKWGEPSFITKHGSTLRMDWKEKSPNQYAMYFQCTSRLVKTFRTVFEDQLRFEGNRAIIFDLNEGIPTEIVKECIRASLIYHKVKHLMTLGI